jgi:hypothetical protein
MHVVRVSREALVLGVALHCRDAAAEQSRAGHVIRVAREALELGVALHCADAAAEQSRAGHLVKLRGVRWFWMSEPCMLLGSHVKHWCLGLRCSSGRGNSTVHVK